MASRQEVASRQEYNRQSPKQEQRLINTARSTSLNQKSTQLLSLLPTTVAGTAMSNRE